MGEINYTIFFNQLKQATTNSFLSIYSIAFDWNATGLEPMHDNPERSMPSPGNKTGSK